jgi:hypothetical protein
MQSHSCTACVAGKEFAGRPSLLIRFGSAVSCHAKRAHSGFVIDGAETSTILAIKESFGGMYKGRKVFVDENQLIFLFG